MSENNERNENNLPPKETPFHNPSHSIVHSIDVYTILRVLKEMRKNLGIEAMVEYVDHYIQQVDGHNAKLAKAVTEAIALMSMERVYEQVLHRNQE